MVLISSTTRTIEAMITDSRSSETGPHPFKKDASKDYLSRLQLLLREIDHRYIAPPSPSVDFLRSHHDWIHNTLGPVSSWNTHKLDILEDSSSAVIERAYPFADTSMRILMGKLTALVIVIDDSMDNEAMYNEIGNFAHRLYIGESQKSGILSLYHDCIKELSHVHQGDAVQRGLAIVPWINFVDACLLEKRLLTINTQLRASPYDMGYQHLVKQKDCESQVPRDTSPGARIQL